MWAQLVCLSFPISKVDQINNEVDGRGGSAEVLVFEKKKSTLLSISCSHTCTYICMYMYFLLIFEHSMKAAKEELTLH